MAARAELLLMLSPVLGGVAAVWLFSISISISVIMVSMFLVSPAEQGSYDVCTRASDRRVVCVFCRRQNQKLSRANARD